MKISHLILLIVVLVLSACGNDEETQKPTSPPSTTARSQELTFYNWDTYIDPQILTDFEAKFNVNIIYETFGTNEELLDNLQANPTKYDLIVPTDYMVFGMRSEGMLSPLNRENIPNFDNLDPTFINSVVDPGNRYCVPYQWGTFGIGYNIEVTGRPITTLGEMFDPEFSGKIAILDEARSSLGMVLLYLGYSPNTANRNEIFEARDFLLERIDQIAFIAPDNGQDLLLAGEIAITTEWSGDIFQVMSEDENVRFAIPDEGAIIWTDMICVPNGARNQELAEQFLNYLLEPEVGASLSNYIHYATPNLAAKPFIDPNDLDNPALYPEESVRDRLFYQTNLGAEVEDLYSEAWVEILSAKQS